MNLAGLIKQSAKVTVEYAGEKLTVEYAPQRMNATYTDRLRDAGNQAGFGPMLDVLVEVLLGWDLNNDGKPIKLTKDAMLDLPFWLMVAVSDAVMEDFNGLKVIRASQSG